MRLVVLVSGSGTNLQAVLDAVASGASPVEVVAVGSDVPEAQGLARAEAQRFGPGLDDSAMGEPWDSVYQDEADWDADPDWDFTSAAQDSPAQLYALWDDTVARSRTRLAAALADGGLDQPVSIVWADGRRASLRRSVCDLIEEYGRHTGHADLLREAVDGLVGEDPPQDWRPRRH